MRDQQLIRAATASFKKAPRLPRLAVLCPDLHKPACPSQPCAALAYLLHSGASDARMRVNAWVTPPRRVAGVAIRTGGPVVGVPFVAGRHLQRAQWGGETVVCGRWY